MLFVLLGLLGLAFGSFVNALVWRLHLREKVANRKQQIDKKRSSNISVWRGRSMCPECKHVLGTKDLVPVFSWLWLKGRCRYCKRSISWQYPVVELVTVVLFMVSYLFWPGNIFEIIQGILFVLWLFITTVGVALAVYDFKWMLLPNRLVYTLAGFSALFAVVANMQESSPPRLVTSIIGSVVFGGFFYLLYQISSGKWIGGGDVRLGFVLGLLLGWQKSILALTLAAYIGTAIVVVLVLVGKYRARMKLPFGPLLLGGAFIAFVWGQNIIDWYLRISGLVQ